VCFVCASRFVRNVVGGNIGIVERDYFERDIFEAREHTGNLVFIARRDQEFAHKSYFIASMPEVISETSRVMAAWRTLLKRRVMLWAISFALSVALFIATMRAECSDALFSRSAWNTAILRSRGRS